MQSPEEVEVVNDLDTSLVSVDNTLDIGKSTEPTTGIPPQSERSSTLDTFDDDVNMGDRVLVVRVAPATETTSR
jgi:hypothetical protein